MLPHQTPFTDSRSSRRTGRWDRTCIRPLDFHRHLPDVEKSRMIKLSGASILFGLLW